MNTFKLVQGDKLLCVIQASTVLNLSEFVIAVDGRLIQFEVKTEVYRLYN